MTPPFLIAFIVLAGAAWLLVCKIRVWAHHRQLLDIPNHRSSHTQPIPRGGGLAIVAICLSGWFGLLAFFPDENRLGMACYGAAAAMVAAISFLDDLKTVSSMVRFAVHSAAASLVMIGYGAWNVIPLPYVGNVSLGWLGIPLTFVWIIGLTNAYNFMDGIDGIAAVQAIIAGAGWFLLGRIDGQETICWLALLITAASAGFLVHNWPPARIFMGDVGSAFLGFSFGFLALKASREDPRMGVAGVLLVWPFVFDSAFTFLRRASHRENIFAAHRSHLYQRLILVGWSHSSTTLLYAGLDLGGLLLAFLYVSSLPIAGMAAVAGLAVLACGLYILVIKQERIRPNSDQSQIAKS